MASPISFSRRRLIRSSGAAGLLSTGLARGVRAGEPGPTHGSADNLMLQGVYAPIHTEYDVPNLTISGEFPKALRGTLYRNGPNPQFTPRGPYHWFDGDAMIHAFHIDNGRVSYRNRWVRTPRWLAEHAAGESLIGSFGDPRTTDPRAKDVPDSTANTNVVWHAGRLMALEESASPFLLDPATLATRGSETYGGEAPGPFTAHPKIDPQTGEMIFFGYAAKGPHTPFVSLHVADRNGALTRAEMLETPFASMIHDFSVTRDWIIVPVFPLTDSRKRARTLGQPFAWEPDKGTHIAFIPRRGTVADVKWVTTPACYVFHPMNAHDTPDGKVVIDIMRYDFAPLFPRPDGSPVSKLPPPALLYRWTADLSGGGTGFKEEQLDDHSGEFPRIDERFSMTGYRHGWTVSARDADPETGDTPQDGLAHYEMKTGKRTVWKAGPNDRFSEPVFVARAPDAAEGDGWILSVIYRGDEDRSELALLEATSLDKGPVALAHLASRVPAGFHGNWRPGAL